MVLELSQTHWIDRSIQETLSQGHKTELGQETGKHLTCSGQHNKAKNEVLIGMWPCWLKAVISYTDLSTDALNNSSITFHILKRMCLVSSSTLHIHSVPSPTSSRGKTFHNLFLNLTESHLVLNRSKSRDDKRSSKEQAPDLPVLQYLSAPTQVLLFLWHRALSTNGALSPCFSPFRSIHFEYHKYLNIRWLLEQLTLHYFSYLKIYCFSAARKSQETKMLRSAPIHCKSMMGFLVLFLIFSLPYKERKQDWFPQNCWNKTDEQRKTKQCECHRSA